MDEFDQLILEDLYSDFKRLEVNFQKKIKDPRASEIDMLMEMYQIDANQKSSNPQFYSSQLGHKFELLVRNVAMRYCPEYAPEIHVGTKVPCDLCIGRDAIDVKYRVGFADSGTIDKLRQNAQLLSKLGYTPVLLIFRDDNRIDTIRTAINSGWTVYMGNEAFDYINRWTGCDILGLIFEYIQINQN